VWVRRMGSELGRVGLEAVSVYVVLEGKSVGTVVVVHNVRRLEK